MRLISATAVGNGAKAEAEGATALGRGSSAKEAGGFAIDDGSEGGIQTEH